MGGALEAESVEGAGSVFTLSLALPHAQASPAFETTPASPAGPRPSMRVLIVDDNANNRRLLEVLLDHIGAKTHPAADGQEALDAWRSEHFDVIVMDMQMPVMDGLATTRSIREIE